MSESNRVIIAGVPNSGKSALFNKLQARYSMTGNYPHTTIAVQAGKMVLRDTTLELLDLPGINSLRIFSEDEIPARDILIRANSDIVIQCVDASNLGRSLLLTAELMELGLSIIICLNFIDEARAKGIWVDGEKLQRLLKVPVVETIAHEGKGVGELKNRLHQARKSNGHASHLLAGPAVRKKTDNLSGSGVQNASPDAIDMAVLKSRTRWVEKIISQAVSKSEVSTNEFSEAAGRLVRHPVLGWLVLAAVLFSVYFLVGRIAAVHMAGWLDGAVFSPLAGFIGRMIPWLFLREFLVGEYGLLTLGLFTALGTVLPILTIFFVIMSFLEETGYISNLCVLTNNLLKRVGLSGKSILPLTLAFGCKMMATLTTRILDSRKEKYIAIFLIAFAIPCSVQLGLYLAILGYFPFSAALITFSVWMVLEVSAGLALNRFIKTDKATDFILEIPPMRFPHPGNLAFKVCWRMKQFLREALPLFMLGAAVLFTLDNLGILLLLRKVMSPVVTSFLSLPIESLDGFLLCLVRHEQGAVFFVDLAKNGRFSWINAIVCIVAITIPCVSNMAAITREIRVRPAALMTLCIITGAVLAAGAVNWLLRIF